MPRRYFYMIEKKSKARGMNRKILVYLQKSDGRFSLLGSEDVNTASYEGDLPVAVNIIKAVTGVDIIDKVHERLIPFPTGLERVRI